MQIEGCTKVIWLRENKYAQKFLYMKMKKKIHIKRYVGGGGYVQGFLISFSIFSGHNGDDSNEVYLSF